MKRISEFQKTKTFCLLSHNIEEMFVILEKMKELKNSVVAIGQEKSNHKEPIYVVRYVVKHHGDYMLFDAVVKVDRVLKEIELLEVECIDL